MAFPPTNLLSLPREISNQIYSYIHRPVYFDCPDPSPPVTGYAKVEVPMAPVTDILFTCTQLEEESRESCVYTNHTAILQVEKSSVYLESYARAVSNATDPPSCS
jgi:hypothetical protein